MFIKLRTAGLVVALGVTQVACGGGAGAAETTAANTGASAATVPAANGVVRLIHFNDLHAHLTPHKEQIRDSNGNIQTVTRGGLARIATRVKQLRAENANSLLMNIGDTYHGGVEALYSNGNAIVDAMNALGVDVGVPGNWDFAYGPRVSRARYNADFASADVKAPGFPNLAANVTLTMPPRYRGQPFLPASAMFTLAGINVGVIGITSDIVPRMSKALAVGFDFLSARADYLALVNDNAAQLRANGANIVVVMSELGIHKDLDLANDFTPNAVDVVFSAHTHEATFTPQNSASGTMVVEAGNDTYLGHMDIEVANGKVVNRSWTLEGIDDTIAEDAAMLTLVNAARAPYLDKQVNMSLPSGLPGFTLNEPIDTVVGTTPIPLDRRSALENVFNNAATDIMRQMGDSDIAMTPGFRFDSVVAAQGAIEDNVVVASGNITLEDLYRFYPTSFYIARGEVTGQRLKEVIEGNLTAVFSTQRFNHSGGWFDGYSGLDLKVNLANADGARIEDIRLAGSTLPLGDGDVLSVTGCSRPVDANPSTTLCSYSGFSNVTRLSDPATGQDLTPVEMFRYGLDHGMLPTTVRHNIVDSNNTPMWPSSDYYQPLAGAQ